MVSTGISNKSSNRRRFWSIRLCERIYIWSLILAILFATVVRFTYHSLLVDTSLSSLPSSLSFFELHLYKSKLNRKTSDERLPPKKVYYYYRYHASVNRTVRESFTNKYHLYYKASVKSRLLLPSSLLTHLALNNDWSASDEMNSKSDKGEVNQYSSLVQNLFSSDENEDLMQVWKSVMENNYVSIVDVSNGSTEKTPIVYKNASLDMDQVLRLKKRIEEIQSEPPHPSDRCLQNNLNDVRSWCKRESKYGCQEEKPLPRSQQREVVAEADSTSTLPTCKTLWFSGFSEAKNSRCSKRAYGGGDDENTFGIRMDYAVALESARLMASDTLQPVLLLGRYGLKDNEDVSALREYALQRGVVVILIHELSFQSHVISWHRNSPADYQTGPYMRLDIPKLIHQYKLFDILPNICPKHILYTDNDIVFMNQITHESLYALKAQMEPQAAMDETWLFSRNEQDIDTETASPMIMYGREFTINKLEPFNTGVMLLDVDEFRKEWPYILHFRVNHEAPVKDFITFDQGWLQLYFEQKFPRKHRRNVQHDESVGDDTDSDLQQYINRFNARKPILLPVEWNWKIYWSIGSSNLSDSSTTLASTTTRRNGSSSRWKDIKIVHFHGPKPHSGAWLISDCDITLRRLGTIHYKPHIATGICCDNFGQTAHRIRQLYNVFQPVNSSAVC